MRLGSLLQQSLMPGRSSHVPNAPVSPPGVPPANPLGLTPPAALANQQTPAEAMPAEWMPGDAPPKPAPGVSKGQLILGILADALAGAQGKPGMFAQQIGQQRQQAAETARWELERRAGREDKQWEWANKPRETTPYRWEANDGSLMEMAPDGSPRMVYKDPTPRANADPDVFITLPNGQVYAGPRSGLVAAMTGGGPAAPAAPVGRLTPIDGGPTPAASGTFRPW